MIVMERMEKTLGDASRKATYDQQTDWFIQLSDVFSDLHALGLSLGDLTVSNCMFGTDGQIRLIDYDEAKVAEKEKDYTNDIIFLGRAIKEARTMLSQAEMRVDDDEIQSVRDLIGGDVSKKPSAAQVTLLLRAIHGRIEF